MVRIRPSFASREGRRGARLFQQQSECHARASLIQAFGGPATARHEAVGIMTGARPPHSAGALLQRRDPVEPAFDHFHQGQVRDDHSCQENRGGGRGAAAREP